MCSGVGMVVSTCIHLPVLGWAVEKVWGGVVLVGEGGRGEVVRVQGNKLLISMSLFPYL